MKTRYRIVEDSYAGYEVQKKLWWIPFWYQCRGKTYFSTNTFSCPKDAEEWAKKLMNEGRIVKEVSRSTAQKEAD